MIANTFIMLVPLILLIQAIAFTPNTAQVQVRQSAKSRDHDDIIRYASTIHHQHQSERNIIVLSHNVSQNVLGGYFDVNCLLTGRVDVLCRCINSALWVSNGIRQDTTIYLMLFPQGNHIMGTTIEVRGQGVIELKPDERTTALLLQRALLASGREEATDEELENNQSKQKQSRQESEIDRLQERNLKRPDTINPNKPGALSKSQRNTLRTARKAREAMVRRIQRSSGDGSPPQGFTIHHETLTERLQKLEGRILMLNEHGKSVGEVLSGTIHSNENSSDNISTNIILGDQIGYDLSDEEVLAKNKNVTRISLGPLSLLTSQCITIVHHYLDA